MQVLYMVYGSQIPSPSDYTAFYFRDGFLRCAESFQFVISAFDALAIGDPK